MAVFHNIFLESLFFLNSFLPYHLYVCNSLHMDNMDYNYKDDSLLYHQLFYIVLTAVEYE